MSDEERELRERLAPGPAPKPPEGLLEKLKADIPVRLPSNVRAFRPRLPVTMLRVAAALFVVGGAAFVVSHLPRETHEMVETHETPSLAPSEAPPAAPAETPRAVEEVPAPTGRLAALPRKAKQEKEEDQPRAERKAEATGAFAPAMPKAPAAPPPPDASPVEQAAPEAGLAAAPSRRDAEAPGKVAQNVSPRPQESSSAARDRAEETAPRAAASAQRAAGPMPSAEVARASRRVVPTAGSLLAEVLGRPIPPAAARDGAETLVLLSVERAQEAELSGEEPLEVLSAAVLPGGGVVVLARTRGEAAGSALRADGRAASITRVAPSIAAAGADLRVAVLAWRLERALASGDAEERASVAREAAALARVAPRAEVLVRLASR